MSWASSTLGEHISILSGYAFKSKNFNTDGIGLPLIRIRNVVPRKSSTYYEGDYDDQFIVNNGDLLVGMDGEFNRANWRGGKSLLNQRVCKITASSGNLDGGYLFHLLPQVLKKIEDKTPFVTVKHLSARELKATLIPLPPLEEQKRIAAILDQADALRRLRQRALDRLNTFGQSIFYEMFGDVLGNSMDWDSEKCSNLCNRITVGVVVKPASHYKESGVPAIRGTNIKLSGIDLSDVVYFSETDNQTKLSKTRVWEGDLIIVRTGKPGLAAVVPPELNGVNSIDVLIVTPNERRVSSKFLRDLINSPAGKQLVISSSRGQIQQHFNVGSLSNAPMICPPLELQSEYEERTNQLEAQIGKYKHAILASESLFASLQQRAFRGEL